MVGAPAPDLCLHDLRGQWVVLYAYPRGNTRGFTFEDRLFSGALDAFEARNVTVIGISPDSPANHARFAEKHALRHCLLSDEGHGVLRSYGAWKEKNLYGKKMMGSNTQPS